MKKTLDERLFELLTRIPHELRKAIRDIPSELRDRPPHELDHHGPHGPHHHGPHDPHHHGPHDPHHHGPHHHGPHHHGPHDPHHHHGPHGALHHGPEHEPLLVSNPIKRESPAFGRERVLEYIGQHENGIRQKMITEEFGINPSSASELVSKLENDGYVKRTVDLTDKRATLITLTELGEARAAEVSDERNEYYASIFGNLSNNEKEQLIILLEKIIEKAPLQKTANESDVLAFEPSDHDQIDTETFL